jgi:hypothetical protein
MRFSEEDEIKMEEHIEQPEGTQEHSVHNNLFVSIVIPVAMQIFVFCL